MPPATTSGLTTAARHDDLDNYDVNDFSDDPFASPEPEQSQSTKKRKEPDSGLGIDEEISVQKRARVPNVKLDEERLLGPNGIPELRKRAGHLKIKGKGHEFSDASRLLSFYQLWLDDLFPKAKFLDALTMVEKAGHKKRLISARNDFINEGKIKDREEETFEDDDPSHEPEPSLPALLPERPKTPVQDDIPDDDDLYDATPRASRPIVPIRNDVPEEDDLEALMAEAEGQDDAQPSKTNTSQPSKANLPPPSKTSTDPEEDDLDALIAEAEFQDQGPKKSKSQSGGGEQDFDDDEAAMQEMEGLW